MAKVKGEGSVVQLERDKPKGKCRKWQLRVPVGLDPRTGKYRTRTRRVAGTYTEAKAALRSFIAEVEGDRVQTRSGTTFEGQCARFMEQRRLSGSFAASTLAKNESNLKIACRHIGRADFAKVTPDMLNDMYAALLAGDTPSGRPAGGSYVRLVHKTVSLVYKKAVREGLVSENPCDRATPPREDSEPRRALKPQQVAALMAELDPAEETDAAYYLAIALGLRRGEVCGLSWGDVDLDDMSVSVRHSYDVYGNLKSPKTEAGARMLPLSSEVADALRRHREAQEARGVEISPESPVVLDGDGKRLKPDTMGYRWSRDRAALGLEGWKLHELRHSYLTMLAVAGVHPKVMQELAGHSSCAITMDIYTHVNMDSKRQAADTLAKALAAVA